MTARARPRRAASGAIDWPQAHARLARVQAAMEQALAPSAEAAHAIMEARARALARARPQAEAPADLLELLVFGLGRERYAVETRFVREVTRLLDFTRVPGAPDPILGITALRGEMLALVDLRRFFSIAEHDLTDLSRLIVLGQAASELGIVVDSADTVERLPLARVLAPPELAGGIGRGYLRGVTADALIIIDAGALLADTRLVVDQGTREDPGA